jgi:hypothetical protein
VSRTGGAVPSDLLAAINASAQRYKVPSDLLVGIWRIESGSSYPNPFVNSSGYGGLFGTTDWNGSTQSQADLSASILARLLKENNGSVSQALSQYSGGGYTSVPGQTTFGGAGAAGGAQTPSASRTRPDVPAGSGGGGTVADIVSALGIITDPADAIWSGIFGGNISSIADVFKGLIWLMKPSSWLRAVEFVTGMVLMLLSAIGLAVVFMQRSETVGKAAGIASALPGPVGVAGRAVTTVHRPRPAVRRHVQRQERRRRGELDDYYRERGDELDPRRRARAEQRELRQQETRERVEAARSRTKKPGAANEGSLGEFGFG